MLKLEQPPFNKVLKEAGGDEQLLKEQIDKVQLWLKQQPHLPRDNISNERIRYTICTTKFDFEKIKKRLDTYYTIRNLIPEIFENRDPLNDNMTQFRKCMQWLPLPKLTPENYRITIAKFLSPDVSLFNAAYSMKYSVMTLETRVEEDTVNSDIIVWDFHNLRMGHALKYTPVLVKKLDTCLEAIGVRIKTIYIINAPNFMDYILGIVKSVMRAKLFQRIQIYTSGIESLYGIIPKSLFPADYGGEQLSTKILADMWYDKLVERRNWFLEQEKITANESLRSNSVINSYDLFGLSGTFRKLDID